MTRLLISGLLLFAYSQLSAQLYFKLEPLPGGLKYGVFVRPCGDVYPTANTITGSGQVTVVYPTGLTLTEFANHAGTWTLNSTVAGPSEAPGMVYASVGFLMDNPKVDLNHDTETLLFSFKLNGNATGEPYLINNETDPFNQLPNSVSSNPGNEFSVIDFGSSPVVYYAYSGNYIGLEPGCEDNIPQDSTGTNPQDSTIVNPQDTTTMDSTIVENPSDTTQQTTATASILARQNSIFVAYPNPASNWIKVKYTGKELTGKGAFQLWSMEGIPLGRLEKGKDDLFAMNIGALPPGIYLVTFEMDGRILQRERFLKN